MTKGCGAVDARALAGGGSGEPGVPRVAPCGGGLLRDRVEQDHRAEAGVRLGLGVCVGGGAESGFLESSF